MSELQLIMDLGNIAAGFLFWVSLLFPLATSIVWPWWQSWWGRNIASLEFALAIALFPSVAYREFGVYAHTLEFSWMVIGALFAAGVIVAWRGILVFKTQWQYRGSIPGDERDDIDKNRGV